MVPYNSTPTKACISPKGPKDSCPTDSRIAFMDPAYHAVNTGTAAAAIRGPKSRSLVPSSGKEDFTREDDNLAAVFDQNLRYKTAPVKHDRTIVRLVSWHEDYSDLKTKPEVDDLRKVFEDEYHFEVDETVLNPKSTCPPQLQLIRGLIDMMENNSDKTLLIIYYAGHGWKGSSESGTLYLSGNTSQSASEHQERNSIAWHSITSCFKWTLADVLVIFDCCYAGALRGPHRSLHSWFDFLGACAGGERTPKPGPKSFTRALISALIQLKEEPGFDSAELERRIQHVSSSSVSPVLFNRQKPTPDHVWIAPHTTDNSEDTIREIPLQGRNKQLRNKDRPTECVDVRFHFTKRQKREEIGQLAQALREFIKHEGQALGLGRVSFLNKTSLFQNVALRWREISGLIHSLETEEQEEEIRSMIRQEVREVKRRDTEMEAPPSDYMPWWTLKWLLAGTLVTFFFTRRQSLVSIRSL